MHSHCLHPWGLLGPEVKPRNHLPHKRRLDLTDSCTVTFISLLYCQTFIHKWLLWVARIQRKEIKPQRRAKAMMVTSGIGELTPPVNGAVVDVAIHFVSTDIQDKTDGKDGKEGKEGKEGNVLTYQAVLTRCLNCQHPSHWQLAQFRWS